jgi:hypothetical protein
LCHLLFLRLLDLACLQLVLALLLSMVQEEQCQVVLDLILNTVLHDLLHRRHNLRLGRALL